MNYNIPVDSLSFLVTMTNLDHDFGHKFVTMTLLIFLFSGIFTFSKSLLCCF